MYKVILIVLASLALSVADPIKSSNDSNSTVVSSTSNSTDVGPSSNNYCVCGVFLSGQIPKGFGHQPKGHPALLQEFDEPLMCGPLGKKQCINKCLDAFVKHLPNSPTIICGAIDRDIHKERVYIFMKNCNDAWINTNLSAGREYCCKDNTPYKCPML